MGMQLAPLVMASLPLTLVCCNPQQTSIPKGTHIASVWHVYTSSWALPAQKALSLGPDKARYQKPGCLQASVTILTKDWTMAYVLPNHQGLPLLVPIKRLSHHF